MHSVYSIACDKNINEERERENKAGPTCGRVALQNSAALIATAIAVQLPTANCKNSVM